MVRVAVVALLGCAGCLQPDVVPCGDHTCPVDTVCTPGGCATPANAAACAGVTEGDACLTGDVEGGICLGGTCQRAICGDGIVSPGEFCDDGNTLSADGCSADCTSGETCGNQIVDGAVHEECDTGLAGLAGDGCSSTCTREVDLWLGATTPLPYLNNPGVAEDPLRGVVVWADASTWRWTGESWLRLTPATEPSPRERVAMALDTDRHRVVMFGGGGGGGLLDETWEWDGLTWTQRTPPVSPPVRSRAAMTYDSVRHRIVLFGGGGTRTDTWEWDGTTWTERVTAVHPGGTRTPFLAFDGTQSVLVAGDATWTWDGATWVPRADTSLALGIAYSPALGAVVVARADATYERFVGGTWSAPVSVGATPLDVGTRFASDSRRSRLVAIGRTNGDNGLVGELDAVGWTAISPLFGPARVDSAAYDLDRGLVVALDPFERTWRWDGNAWERDPVVSRPRAGPMAYDPVRRAALVLSEPGAGTTMELWRFDGTTWTLAPATAAPADRRGAAFAFDGARGVALMVGGAPPGSPPIAETWLWDGSAWTQAQPTTSPPPRDDASLAYDPRRARMLLFGGHDADHTALADTWAWDGVAWTELTSTVPAPARASAAFAYDPARGVMVMTSSIGDVWELDGSEWHLRQVPIPTSNDAPLVQDRTGGLVSDHVPHRLAYRDELALPDRCLGAADDTDGDHLAGCADPDCWTRCTPLCPPNVACPADARRCGDHVCAAPLEDHSICPTDCDAPP